MRPVEPTRALAFSTLTGKHATLKPCARGSAPRLTSFSIWQYSRSIPAKCASQMMLPSPVRLKSSAMS